LNMKEKIRIVAVLLVLAMLFMFAASCGSDKTDNPSSTNPSGAAPTANPSNPSTAAPNQTPGNSDNTDTEAQPPEDAPKYGGVYRYAVPNEPSALFLPYRSMNGYEWITPVIESLCWRHPETYEFHPLLAESWTQDDKVVTFKLKKGIHFTDGSELTADVVAWNFELAMENGNGASFYNPVFNRIDDYTLEVVFDQFYLNAVGVLATRPIYSKKAYEDNGLDWCLVNLVGTGPFVLKEYVQGSRIVFERNDNYWQAGLPYLDGWEILLIPEAATQMAAFTSDEIMRFTTSDAGIAASITALGYEDVSVQTYDSGWFTSLLPSNRDPDSPWAKKEVRQAVLLYGIDYNELALLANGPMANVYHQCGFEGSLFYDPDIEKAYVYDLEKAKQMLADAGYPDGFTTTLSGIPANVSVMTALQDILKRLNITCNVVETNPTDPARYDGSLRGLVVSNGASAWDATTGGGALVALRSTAKAHASHIDFTQNPDYGRLIDEASKARTYDERAEAAGQAQRILFLDEAFAAIAYFNGGAAFRQPYVRGELMEYNTFSPRDTWFDK